MQGRAEGNDSDDSASSESKAEEKAGAALEQAGDLAPEWNRPPYPAGPTPTAAQGNPYAGFCALLSVLVCEFRLSWSAVGHLLRGMWALHARNGDEFFHVNAVPWLPRSHHQVRAWLGGAFPPGCVR